MRIQQRSARDARWPGRRAILRASEGAQLLEFALVLPLLVVLVIGVSDFGGAYTLKDKLANAAREGARIAASQSRSDLTQTTPPSVGAVRDAVVNYLTNAQVTTCSIGTTPTSLGNFTWTYSSATAGCTANPILTIERNFTITANGTTILCTRVTLTYPFTWTFGRIITLLAPSSNYPGTLTISTSAVMQNLN